jgi:hypothetical protein
MKATIKNNVETTKAENRIENVVIENGTSLLTEKKKVVRVSLKAKKETLLNKENKSVFDFVKLANVTDKIENKTLSKVYKNVISNEYTKVILGSSKIPTFKDFAEKMKVKESYSNWDGYLLLSKFNVKNELNKKVARQNKKESTK